MVEVLKRLTGIKQVLVVLKEGGGHWGAREKNEKLWERQKMNAAMIRKVMKEVPPEFLYTI